MSAQGKWRVVKTHSHMPWEIYDEINDKRGAFFEEADARAVVAAHNAQCEAEPVGWQWRYCASSGGPWSAWKFCVSEVHARVRRGVATEVRPLYTVPPPPASAVAKVEKYKAHWAQQSGMHQGLYSGERMRVADEIICVLKEEGL